MTAKTSLTDMFPQTAETRKRLWIYFHDARKGKDIQPIWSDYVETVVLMSYTER